MLDAIVARLSTRSDVRSILEVGSAAFGRDDERSDIDLAVDVEDGAEAAVFAEVEAALESLAPIAHRWRIPEPAWHGMSQRFYRLEGAPVELSLDLCLRTRSRRGHFSEVELHGTPRVLLDREGCAVPAPLDPVALQARIRDRIAQLRERWPFTGFLPGKELARGRIPDAFAFYWSMNLAPLVELLRIRHCPARHAFGMRYLDGDLPPELAARIASLVLVKDAEDLGRKHRECVAWIEEELARHVV